MEAQELIERVGNLERYVGLLRASSTIPLEIDQAFRARFPIPLVVQRTLDFGNTAAVTSSILTVDMPGAKVGDLILVTPPPAAIVGNLGGIFVGYVSSTGVVTIRFINPDTGSALNPASGTFTIAAIRP